MNSNYPRRLTLNANSDRGHLLRSSWKKRFQTAS
jgi:hypothetical protein